MVQIFLLLGITPERKRNNKFDLKCPEDLIKDQTYFLYRLNQEQLSKSFSSI